MSRYHPVFRREARATSGRTTRCARAEAGAGVQKHMTDSSKGVQADTPADPTKQPGGGPAPANAPKPVDTGAQERAGQDREDSGGYK